MGWSYQECCDKVDGRELSLWKAHDRLNPLDRTRRLEVAIGTLVAAVLAPHTKSNPKASDYINDWFGAEVKRLEEVAPAAVEPIDVNQDVLSAKIDAAFGF